jgi:hypothetical protein
MSDLTFLEKRQLEELLNMKGGYVVDFNDRSFAEFFKDTVGIDIDDDKYCRGQSRSKANRLREFWRLENNEKVGSVLSGLIGIAKTLTPAPNVELIDVCERIVQRLLGTLKRDGTIDSSRQTDFHEQKGVLLSRLDTLWTSSEGTKRGLELEKLLNEVFKLYDIPTKAPFRRSEGGEQVDGAFKFQNNYFLVECKWTEHTSSIGDLDSLDGKVSRSGKQTLGLFLSINGWSRHLVRLAKQNTNKAIILMDGYDLRSSLCSEMNLSLASIIEEKIQALHFYSEPFLSCRSLGTRSAFSQ